MRRRRARRTQGGGGEKGTGESVGRSCVAGKARLRRSAGTGERRELGGQAEMGEDSAEDERVRDAAQDPHSAAAAGIRADERIGPTQSLCARTFEDVDPLLARIQQLLRDGGWLEG